MKAGEIIGFTIRIICFLVTYFFMLDYLCMCNFNTVYASGITIICAIIITAIYIPLRGNKMLFCSVCNNAK